MGLPWSVELRQGLVECEFDIKTKPFFPAALISWNFLSFSLAPFQMTSVPGCSVVTGLALALGSLSTLVSLDLM